MTEDPYDSDLLASAERILELHALSVEDVVAAHRRFVTSRASESGATRDLLKPRDAAALLNVDPRTLSRWAAQGYVTSYFTPGGHHRYDRDELREWIAATVQYATTPPPVDVPADVADIIDKD